MDLVHSCRCCLRAPPDKDLTTPYTHLGETEIYSDMLVECFDIHVEAGDAGSCGICAACAGRLRDARDFKLQVTVQTVLRGHRIIMEVKPEVKSEMADKTSVFDVSHEPPIFKPEMIDNDGPGEEFRHGDPLIKTEPEDPPSDEDYRETVPHRMDIAGPAYAFTDDAYTCDTCGKHFTGKASLIEHVHTHAAPTHAHTDTTDTYPTQMCSVQFSITCEEGFYCEICHQQFWSSKNLNRHRKTHSQEPFVCRICDETFTKRAVFKRHKRMHALSKTFTCKECNKEFTMKSNLYKHKRIHTGEKPYKCDFCTKEFTAKTNYDVHRRIHTGEKPYGCEECDKQFRQRGDLERHKRLHTGEKPYSCDECYTHFTMKSHLNAHKRIHTGEKPYACEECDKHFSRKNHLDTHKRIHTGEKPYGCEVCSKQFSRKCDLDRHVKIHVGEKPYKCEVCETIFTRKSSLIRHVGKHETQPFDVVTKMFVETLAGLEAAAAATLAPTADGDKTIAS